MNRTDELTDGLIDGILTDAEAEELEALLAADPAAQARHLTAVRLELVLRGLRTEFDLAGPTVAKIETDRVERMTAAVMAELAHRPAPIRRQSVRRVRVWAAFASLAAAILVAVWFGMRPGDSPHRPDDPPSPAAADFARLISVTGTVELVSAAGETAARQDQLLTPDQTLRTVGDESVAIVEFPDRTRIEIHPESIVRFGPEPTGELTRKLFLIQGRITAVTEGSRLVVGAGATEVKASRSSFALWSAGSGSARVESTAGDVQVSHGAPAELVLLGPGHAAYVRDERTPMRIDARWRIDSEPRARLDFPALDVGFTPDGEVVAASAKQWTRWKPGTPEPGRTLFPPKVFNDGLAAWLTPDRRVIAVCRIDDREERIFVRELPSGTERGQIPARVTDPRHLCVAPDASWIATASGQKPNIRRACVWDVTTTKERFAFDLDHSVVVLAASPDGRRLAVGVSDPRRDTGNTVVVFDTTTGERLFELPTRRKAITSLAFSADGKHLAAGFNGAVQIWDVPDRRLVKTLEGFERTVTRVAFDTTGKLLAAGMGDGQVWVWSATTGQRTQVIDTGTRGVRSLAFSADSKFLVTATNKAPVAVWEVVPEPANDLKPDT
jgi:anti-sigma factor RsiW